MTDPMVLMVFAICIVLIISGLVVRGGIYGYPFLAGAAFLGFILPQMPALATDPFLPAGAFTKAAAFTALCAAMCGIGWRMGQRPFEGMQWTFDEKRLLWIAALLSTIGAYFFFAFGRLPDEVRLSTLASGTPVMYLFFARLLTYGFIVAMLCFARRPSWPALVIVLIDAMFVVDRVIATGKRGEFTEFGLAILLALWFQRRLILPRTLAVGAVLLATLLLNSTGDYRQSVRERGKMNTEDLARIEVLKNFEDTIKNGAPEMRNAVQRIEHTDRTMALDFGAFHWNVLVFNFVPAQLVGSEFKRALQIDLDDDRYYTPVLGSTETGMADAFASFWYLGAFKFFLTGWLLARVYSTAINGWVLPQIIYILGITPGIHAVTHHTQWVVSMWVQMALLLLPFLLFARVKRPKAARQAVPLYVARR